jgi:hypothetical protein
VQQRGGLRAAGREENPEAEPEAPVRIAAHFQIGCRSRRDEAADRVIQLALGCVGKDVIRRAHVLKLLEPIGWLPRDTPDGVWWDVRAQLDACISLWRYIAPCCDAAALPSRQPPTTINRSRHELIWAMRMHSAIVPQPIERSSATAGCEGNTRLPHRVLVRVMLHRQPPESLQKRNDASVGYNSLGFIWTMSIPSTKVGSFDPSCLVHDTPPHDTGQEPLRQRQVIPCRFDCAAGGGRWHPEHICTPFRGENASVTLNARVGIRQQLLWPARPENLKGQTKLTFFHHEDSTTHIASY